MQEAKDPESTETANGEQGTEAREPGSTATSSDTLSDIERTEQVSTTTDSEQSGGSGGKTDAPSPDGQFDGSGGDGDAGPM